MSEAAIQATPRTDHLCKEIMTFVDKYGVSREKIRTILTSVLAHAASLELELAEAEEKIAILNAGCARLDWVNLHPDAIYHSNEDGLSQQPAAGWYSVVVIEGKITRLGPFDTIEACIDAAQRKANDE